MTVSVTANIVLFCKVVKAKSNLVNRSKVSYKAELSITITTLSIIASYFINGIFLAFYISFAGTNQFVAYSEVVRPFGNDLQTCVTTWIFYLTHPVFKKTSSEVEVIVSTSSQRRSSRRATN
uniref:Serpentine receptor class gamma n=1 Tax=Caenorhabditis tropicalis TaxID=1561998 RepID=A0A1I7UDE5_9PELO